MNIQRPQTMPTNRRLRITTTKKDSNSQCKQDNDVQNEVWTVTLSWLAHMLIYIQFLLEGNCSQ